MDAAAHHAFDAEASLPASVAFYVNFCIIGA
jgi:hypothetical protein